MVGLLYFEGEDGTDEIEALKFAESVDGEKVSL